MCLNTVRKKEKTEDAGTHKQDENAGPNMGLAHYHMTFYMSVMTKSCLLNRGWQVVIILMQYIVHRTRMAGIKCQMQVINDDEGWIQL